MLVYIQITPDTILVRVFCVWAVDMESLTCTVFLATNLVVTLTLVVDSIRTDNLLWSFRTIVYFLLGECWLVKEIELLGLNGELDDIALGLLTPFDLQLKTTILIPSVHLIEPCRDSLLGPLDFVTNLCI